MNGAEGDGDVLDAGGAVEDRVTGYGKEASKDHATDYGKRVAGAPNGQGTAESPTGAERQVLRENHHNTTNYEFKDGQQRPVSSGFTGFVDLQYNPDIETFYCAFKTYWAFQPPNMFSDKGREQYRQYFRDGATKTWARKHRLIEHDSLRERTGRQVDVEISIDWTVFFKYDALDATQGQQRIEYQMAHPEIRDYLAYAFRITVKEGKERDHVFAAQEVQLRDTSASVSAPIRVDPAAADYDHYRKAGIRIRPQEESIEWQLPAAHEFGHMLGLKDEYPLPKKDYDDLKASMGKSYADKALRRRREVTADIMNIGMNVRRDHYRPFAEWLTSITKAAGTVWGVEGDHP